MDYWQRITLELIDGYGSEERLAKLAMCQVSQIRRIAAGKVEPTYSLGERLMRMHASFLDSRARV